MVVVPARITDEQTLRVQQLGQAFVATECEDRPRRRLASRGRRGPRNELNTMPGYRDASVYAKLFEASELRTPNCSASTRPRAPRPPPRLRY